MYKWYVYILPSQNGILVSGVERDGVTYPTTAMRVNDKPTLVPRGGTSQLGQEPGARKLGGRSSNDRRSSKSKRMVTCTIAPRTLTDGAILRAMFVMPAHWTRLGKLPGQLSGQTAQNASDDLLLPLYHARFCRPGSGPGRDACSLFESFSDGEDAVKTVRGW